MRVSDLVTEILWDHGIECVFLVTGGGAMHLNDAIKKSKLKYVCNHHEGASAIAAEGYTRMSGKMCAVNVTSGPGGTNALTGLMGQWCDSVPVIYLSGQVKYETTIASCPSLGLRQLGDQELNIIDIVKPMTKYASFVKDSKEIRYELEKAIHIAKSGRKGPVWLDIPLDVQGAQVDPNELRSYQSKDKNLESDFSSKNLEKLFPELVERLEKAERPLIIAGSGIRIAGGVEAFRKLCDKIKVPVVTTHNGQDVIGTDDSLYVGRIGTLGSRSGNFALQNSDFVLSIGSRNNIRQVSYAWKYFARSGYFVSVDVDKAELNKPTLELDMKVHSDARVFMEQLETKKIQLQAAKIKTWTEWCRERRESYPTVLESYKKAEKIHPYVFVQKLTELASKSAQFVAGNGSASVSMFQAGDVKFGQRQVWNSGCATMGYDLPAAIGAAVSSDKPVICLAGDGSIMMNLQELQTIISYKLPITIYLLNNEGYQSIKQTQKNYFKNDTIGCDEASGVGFPDFYELAKVFGFKTFKLEKPEEMDTMIQKTLNPEGPTFVEVVLDTNYIFSPKLSSEKKPDGRLVSKPLEDLFPFLDRDEFKKNMIVPPLEECL